MNNTTIIASRAQAYVSAVSTQPHGKCQECWDCDVPTLLGLCGPCYGYMFPGLFS